MALLRVEKLSRHYGGVKAVDGVSLEIEPGNILGLVGPNGSGKTTFVNCVTGYTRLTSGRVLLEDRVVTNWRPNRLATRGIGRTYQVPRLFPSLSVIENVASALIFTEIKPSLWRAFVPPLDKSDRVALRQRALEALDRVEMAHLATRPAGGIALGEARRVEIARALVAAQKLLVLDEPVAGLRGEEAMDIGRLVATLARERQLGVLMIDHNVALVRAFCTKLVVLDFGRVIAEGQPDEVVRRPEVVEAYIGRGAAAAAS